MEEEVSPNYTYMYGLNCYLIDAFSNVNSFFSFMVYSVNFSQKCTFVL